MESKEADVEAVARAIFDSNFAYGEDQEKIDALWNDWEDDRKGCFRQARAAIAALSHGTSNGGREERAAIVAWLQGMAANWSGPVGRAALEMAVRQIERGDHLPKGNGE